MSLPATLSPSKRVTFGVLVAIVAVLGTEALLRLAASLVPRAALVLSPGIPLAIPDAVLGERPNPQVPEHDEAGWRNAERPERARIVAIGDSQTYGQEVARAHAWPQRVESRTGIGVYNMALGGYGPAQYLRLMDEALGLAPEVVLVGFYSGNDVSGAYAAVYKDDLTPELGSRDPAVRAEFVRMEAAGPVEEAWLRTQQANKRSRLALVDGALGDWIRRDLRLYGLWRATRRALMLETGGLRRGNRRTDWPSYLARARGSDPSLLFAVEDARTPTILTPLQRLTALDPSDPRIAEGLRISLDALHDMHAACGTACELAVVFIPTKELCFEELAASQPGAPPELAELVRAEHRLWRELRADLDARGIRWIDTLPGLLESIARGENPFFVDWNGHLNALGNDLVASAVAESAPLRGLPSGRPETDRPLERRGTP